MQQKIETIKGWEIDLSFESQNANLKPKNTLKKQSYDFPTKTLSSERKTSPKRTAKQKTPTNRTPLTSLHRDGSQSMCSIGRLFVKKVYQQQKVPSQTPQLLKMSNLKLRLTELPKLNQSLPKAYSTSQLNSILQLKRKNMYLQSILRKVNNSSEEREQKIQNQMIITHNKASQSIWMDQTMAMKSFFNAGLRTTHKQIRSRI